MMTAGLTAIKAVRNGRILPYYTVSAAQLDINQQLGGLGSLLLPAVSKATGTLMKRILLLQVGYSDTLAGIAWSVF